MNATPLNRMLLAGAISLALLAIGTPAGAQSNAHGTDKTHESKGKKPNKEQRDAKGEKDAEAKGDRGDHDHPARPHPVKPPQPAVLPRKAAERRTNPPIDAPNRTWRDQAEHQRAIGARQVAQQQAVADKQAAQAQRQAEHQRAVHDRVDAKQAMQQQKRDGKLDAAMQRRPGQRLSERQQLANIQRQQESIASYRQSLAQRQISYDRQSRLLQQQNRNNQYLYQQQYFQRSADQQTQWRNQQHDYDNDPYFYTAPSYRYSRDGRSYETNQYGADLFRSAINTGYQEGYHAGAADSRDNWRFSYRDSYIYQDANYGYDGHYVRQDDYNHYFREGFQRGYDDGYYGRRTYGRRDNGAYSMLDQAMTTVLGLQALR